MNILRLFDIPQLRPIQVQRGKLRENPVRTSMATDISGRKKTKARGAVGGRYLIYHNCVMFGSRGEN